MPKHPQLRPQQPDPSPASRPDKRPSSHAPSPIQAMASASPQVQAATQLQAQVSAHVGPPAQLKSPDGLPPAMRQNMERASGFDLSGVRVHRNSTLPAQLQAHAFAQGGHIHLAPGQDRHLPHEAWHVVQQAQGRVKPTHTVAGQPVNLDNGLEAEASRLGSQHSNESTQQRDSHPAQLKTPSLARMVAQRVVVQIHWGVSKAMQPVPINSNDNNNNNSSSANNLDSNNNNNHNDSNIKNTNNSNPNLNLNNNNNNSNNSNSSNSLGKTSNSSNRYSYYTYLQQDNNNNANNSNSSNNPYANHNNANFGSNLISNNNHNSNNSNDTLINHPSYKFISNSNHNNGNTFNNNFNSSNNDNNLISKHNSFINTNNSNFKDNFLNNKNSFLIIDNKSFIGNNVDNKESQKDPNKMDLDNKNVQDQSNDKIKQTPQQQLDSQKKLKPHYVIRRIQFAGRPPKLFKNSMGDHTTSYSVHEKGIEAAILGKDLDSATIYMKWRVDQDHKLPGMALINNLADKGATIQNHLQHLTHLFQAITNDLRKPSPLGPLMLQQLIAVYLEFRELIPLSAINVAEKFPALAGKGKGEFIHVNTLQSYETGANKGSDGLANAIVNLLDMKAIAILAAELNPYTKSNMAPGLDTNWKYDTVLKTIIRQHLLTLQTSFPKAVAGAGIKDIDPAVNLVYQKALPFLKAAIQNEVNYTKNDITAAHTHKENTHKAHALRTNRSMTKFLATQKGQDWQQELDGYDEKIKSLTGFEDQLTKYLEEPDLKGINSDKDTLNELSISRTKSKDAKNTQLDGGLATAISLNNDGTIRNIRIEGRPDSPFGTTQGHGAHTTAWVVHVQVLRTKLIGRTIPEALKQLSGLCKEAQQHADSMKNKIRIDQNYHQYNLNLASQNLQSAGQADFNSPHQQGPALQSLINAYLVWVNMTPGATFLKTNTASHGEADSHAYLASYMQNPNATWQAGLSHMANLLDLDGSEVGNPDIEEEIIERHFALLKHAYPEAYDRIKPYAERYAFRPKTRKRHNKDEN